MAIYIKITKISEKQDLGFYHVFTEGFGGADFYICFNKQEKKIYCSFKKDFSEVVRVIDFNDPNERIGNLPGVDSGIISRIIRQAFKVFELNDFPQYLDYCA